MGDEDVATVWAELGVSDRFFKVEVVEDGGFLIVDEQSPAVCWLCVSGMGKKVQR